MRYLDEGAPLSASEQAEFGEDAWRGSVELEYRYDGLDKAPARMETSVVFVPTPTEPGSPPSGTPSPHSTLAAPTS